MGEITKKEQLALLVRNTPVFRLKPKEGRHFQAIDLKKQFGFLPEVVVFERLVNQKNLFVVRAILTDAEVKKDKAAQEAKKKLMIPKISDAILSGEGGDK